jgi:hypothetical protein
VAGIVAAVEAGRGLVLVPSWVACTTGPRLKLLPLKRALPAIRLVAIWPKEYETKLVKNLIAGGQGFSGGLGFGVDNIAVGALDDGPQLSLFGGGKLDS